MPEFEIAEVTRVGLFPGVNPHVRGQLVLLDKLLAALLALVRLLAGVDPLVLRQRLVGHEGLAAVAARVAPVSSVSALMQVARALPAERLAAVRAEERSLVGVRVLLEALQPREGHGAKVALVRAFAWNVECNLRLFQFMAYLKVSDFLFKQQPL